MKRSILFMLCLLGFLMFCSKSQYDIKMEYKEKAIEMRDLCRESSYLIAEGEKEKLDKILDKMKEKTEEINKLIPQVDDYDFQDNIVRVTAVSYAQIGFVYAYLSKEEESQEYINKAWQILLLQNNEFCEMRHWAVMTINKTRYRIKKLNK